MGQGLEEAKGAFEADWEWLLALSVRWDGKAAIEGSSGREGGEGDPRTAVDPELHELVIRRHDVLVPPLSEL